MRRFESFQGIRALAFLLIFFSHSCGFLELASGGIGAIGVELFIVLSGFLVEYGYRNTNQNLLEESVKYVKKKITKFYWLHILTMLLALLQLVPRWVLDGVSWMELKECGLKILANVLLVQSWIPDSTYYFSLNAVAWYLSTSLLMYLSGPALHRLITRIPSGKYMGPLILIIYGLQVLLGYSLQSSAYLHAIIYVHPAGRILDFAVGMLLGAWFKQRKLNLQRFRGTCLEAAVLVYFMMVVLLFNKVESAFAYVILPAPMAWLMIFVFAHEKGAISSLLSTKLLQFLGNISFELFMIHLLVIRYWGYVSWIIRKIFHCELHGMISIIGTLLISVFSAWVLNGIGKMYFGRKNERNQNA